MTTDGDQDKIIQQITSGELYQLEVAADALRLRAKKTVTKIVRIGGSDVDINTILNDTVLDLIAKIRNGSYDSTRSTIDGLIFTIVKNKWKDELRKRYKKLEFENQYQIQLSSKGNGRTNSIEFQVFTQEERNKIMQALQQLDPIYRELMEQKYLKGISLRVISENLGISEDAVKKRHERGKKKLREILGQDPRIKD